MVGRDQSSSGGGTLGEWVTRGEGKGPPVVEGRWGSESPGVEEREGGPSTGGITLDEWVTRGGRRGGKGLQ